VQPTAAPPPPPEQDAATGADNWPWYFGLLALVVGLLGSVAASFLIGGIWIAAGGDSDDAAFIVIGTAVQSVIFIAAVVWLAKTRGPVTFLDFGLRRAPFWPTVGKMVAIMGSYLVILAIYNALVHLSADDTPDKLGANAGIFGMLCFGVLVAVLAPISEEVFFRGMIFRSFSNGFGVWGGAIASGVLFGALHIDSFASERLLQVVPLGLLGIMFALLYAWSGTLYSTIALHATNNSLAVLVYANDHNSDFGVALAGVLWLLMMIGCTIGWRLTDNGEPAPPAPPAPLDPPVPPHFVSQSPADRPDFPWGQP
jgi:membrane protease YdiL (CAAX protease family)